MIHRVHVDWKEERWLFEDLNVDSLRYISNEFAKMQLVECFLRSKYLSVQPLRDRPNVMFEKSLP